MYVKQIQKKKKILPIIKRREMMMKNMKKMKEMKERRERKKNKVKDNNNN